MALDPFIVELLVDKLTRPMFVMRYARGAIDRPGARKRYENACREIENIVMEWSEEYGSKGT